MVMKETLTNEKLKERFPSQFELVGYAISLVDNMVQSGRGPRVKTTNENPAVIILEEINENKDILDPLPAQEIKPEALSVYSTSYNYDSEKEEEKPAEKKVKARRILQ